MMVNKEKVNLRIRGISCASRSISVEKAISDVIGVDFCNVDFSAEQATITYSASQTSIEDIQKAVKEAGYSSYFP